MVRFQNIFESVFTYIQMIWGFVTPEIVAVFLFGLVFRKAPESSALAAILVGIPIYGILLFFLPNVAFLNHMAITFLILIAIMGFIALFKPLPQAVHFQVNNEIPLESSPVAKIGGIFVILVTAVL